MRTLRVGKSGRVVKSDLPEKMMKSRFRFSDSTAAPDRKTGRYAKKALRELTEGPAKIMPMHIFFYEDGQGSVPVHSEQVNIQWAPRPAADTEFPMKDGIIPPTSALPMHRSVKSRLKMVDSAKKISWHTHETKLSESPGDIVAKAILEENAKSNLQCPNCDGEMLEDQQTAHCSQCGLKATLSVKFEIFPHQPESDWASLWNGGFAYQGVAWGDPDSTKRALNRPEAIPDFKEWKYIGESPINSELDGENEEEEDFEVFDPWEDGDDEDESETSTASPEDFKRMAPSARICALDMLMSSTDANINIVANASSKELIYAAEEWGPTVSIRQLAYRADPTFDDFPGSAMKSSEIDEIASIMGMHAKQAIKRAVTLAITYPGTGGTASFGPQDQALLGWSQWMALPSWARTILRCRAAITRGLDPDGDIRVRYEDYEVVDAFFKTDDDDGRPCWSDLAREAESATLERFDRDRTKNTAMTKDDPFMLTQIAASVSERRRGYRDSVPVNTRRILRVLDSEKADAKLAVTIGLPLTTQYPSQKGTLLLIEERMSGRQAQICGATRRLRAAMLFHSVNRKGEIQQRREDGEPTGAYDVWLSRYWWPFPAQE